MTTKVPRKPQAATCEDCDDDNDTTFVGSRPSANVARKRSQSDDLVTKGPSDGKSNDGSDSGYSSKAGTNDSVSPTRKKGTDLKIDTKMTMERERQPYSHRPSRAEPTRQPSVKAKEPAKEKTAKNKEKFIHQPVGTCRICDYYGYHKELPAPVAAAPPPSPKAPRQASVKTSQEEGKRPKIRTQSSSQQPRPVSVVYTMPQIPPQQHLVYTPSPQVEYHHPVPPYGYQTPITPTTVSNPFHQPYITGTPISTAGPEPPNYFEPPHFFPDPNQPMLHVPSYVPHGEPVFVPYGQPMAPPPPPPPPQLERQPSHGSRSRPVIPKTSQVIEAERKAMPPPRKPETPQPNRPAIRKSTTEYPSRRQSVHYKDDEKTEILAKRSSRDVSAYAPPPSAWKTSAVIESQERPRTRKAASYSEGSDTVHVASSREPMPRRTTVPGDHVDSLRQKEADIEAYQARVSKGRANTLTAETIKKHTSQRSAAVSDAGTHRSKDSQRSKRASTVVSQSGVTRITLDGGMSIEIPQNFDGQPVDLKVGNLSLTMNSSDQTKRPEQKRIERAPSESSQTSRKSPTNGSISEGQPLGRETSRRSTQSDQAKHSANSSRRTSRAPSSTRAGVESSLRREPEFRNPEEYYTEWGA